MNDLITAATSGLFVEVGKVIEHMKAQASRIAELERQLAAPSAPAVEQDKVICANLGELLLTHAQRKAADTDKVREVISDEKIMAIRDEVWQSVHGDDEYDAMDIAFARAVLKASMAAQAPVREVPEDLQLVPKISTSKMDRAGEAVIESESHCDCGNYPMPNLEKVFSAMLAAAPVLQEG